MPGFDGGMEWGGAAADPDGIYYANVNEIPWIYQMIPTRADGKPVSVGERTYKIHCSYCHGLDRKGDSGSGFPPLDQRQRSSRAAIAKVIDNGAGPLPHSATCSALRTALVDFLLGEDKPASDRRGLEGPPTSWGFRRWFDRRISGN